MALVAHGIHDGGGMERAFAELVRRIRNRYDVVVLSSDLGDDLRRLVEWRRVPVPRRPAPLRFALFYAIGGVRLALTRADVVHTLGAIVPNAVDVASVHFCTAGFVERVGRLGAPTAPLVRRVNTGLARALFLAAERWTYRPGRVRRLGAVSRGVAAELARNYPGIAPALTPNGVDTSRFRPDEAARRGVRTELGIAPDEVVALFVGGDWHGKGLALAVDALARAQPRSPAGLRLLVVGDGDRRRFDALAREHGVAEHVVFAGRRRDPERYYAAADVFLLPSWYETFSLAAFEAASSGLPVVASALNGVEELLGDGRAGLLVPRDAESFAAALAALASDPDLRRRLGTHARDRASEYTWDRSAQAVEALYRSVLDGAPRPEAVFA
ncbi:MAG TPA: glycosyltransferase family 4 protein [Gaiellaceae bacterium]|nr:glycosyltransferase family 4 protein [Gaiellaceae bacterium]